MAVVVDHAPGHRGAGPAGEVPGAPPPAVLARDDGGRGQEHRRAERAVVEVMPARPGLVHQRPAGVADAVRGLEAAVDQLARDPQRVVDEEVGRGDVELGVRGVLGLGRVAAVDRLRQRAADPRRAAPGGRPATARRRDPSRRPARIGHSAARSARAGRPGRRCRRRATVKCGMSRPSSALRSLTRTGQTSGASCDPLTARFSASNAVLQRQPSF